MLTKADIIRQITQSRIVAIIRAAAPEPVLPAIDALLDGGVTTLEVTLTTPHALEVIRQASTRFSDRCLIGVGTVLDAHTARLALEAGARFVVTPVLRPDVALATHETDRPVMLGAYTPTEAQLAHEAGADFVKLFPADGLGPAYIKAIRTPLPHLRIVPTGGVNLDTVSSFLQAGSAALGVGSALVSAPLLREANWPELTRRARAFVEAVSRAQG